MESDPLDSRITYTVKELLENIRTSIERMDSKLDGKAESTELAAVAAMVQGKTDLAEHLEVVKRVTFLERDNQERQVIRQQYATAEKRQAEYRRWLSGMVATLLIALATVIPFLLSH